MQYGLSCQHEMKTVLEHNSLFSVLLLRLCSIKLYQNWFTVHWRELLTNKQKPNQIKTQLQ